MDAFSTDVHSSRRFQEWYLRELSLGATQTQIVTALEDIGSLTAIIRALHVAYWSDNSEQSEQYLSLVHKCSSLGDALAAETAKGYEIYHRSMQIMQQGGPNMKVRLSEMKGALIWSQKALSELPPSDLLTEARIGIHIPLCLLLQEEGELEEGISTASQALYLAEQLQAPVTTARARAHLIDCTANAGHTIETAKLVFRDRLETHRFASHYTDMELASSLFRLGNYQEGSAIMDSIVSRTQGDRQERALGFVQRLEALWGIGGLEGPIYATPNGSIPCEWITGVSRSLMLAFSTPREGKAAEARFSHFANVVEVCQSAECYDMPWMILLSQWATVTAHLGRGEFADAAGILDHAQKADPEWLDIRVLILGAALELSLCWQAPEGCSTARYEHQLREVFAAAARIRYASCDGLAQLLYRWHPTAAAYLALAPEPVLACAFATRSVMKVGTANVVEDLSLPPVLACDLMLRALDFDLQRNFTFVQGDAGASRVKRKELVQLAGSVPVWRLPVSAVKIAYGLMRHQSAEYQERARVIMRAYGIRPATTALPPMIGVLEGIERNIRKLLDGHLTTSGFRAEMEALRP